MAQIIVPNVCRYSVIGTYGGNQWANVVDARLFNLGGAATREAVTADFAKELLQAWHDRIKPLSCNEVGFSKVSWVDLNAADGSTGETVLGDGGATWPAVGTSTAAGMPGNVAILARKRILQGRGRRDGRWYFIGLGEDKTADDIPNTIIPSFVTTFNAGLAGLLTDLNQTFIGPDYDARLCVVHITARDVDGHATAGDSRDITTVTIDNTLATMRRRLRR